MNDEDKIKELVAQVSPIQIRSELFRNNKFEFIVTGDNEYGDKVTHEKQREALEILTSNLYEEFLYGGAAGGAKAQPLTAKIYTPFGYKLMGDIKVGDVIKGSNGKNTNVISVHPQGKKKIYEIEFIDGAKTKCCGDHLWKVWYSSRKSKQEKNAQELGKIQTTEMLIKNMHKKPIIPLCEPIEFTLPVNRYSNNIWDKINSYVLGCLIGDGGLTTQVGFTSCDKEIIDNISKRIDKKFSLNKLKSVYAYSITQNDRNDKGYPINELYETIKELGLNCKSEFKFLPKKYLHAPLKERIELTQGLMDTDGTIDNRGHCSYSTSSKELALDFQYVLRSLGFKATISEGETTHLNTFRIYIQGNNCELLFKLKRKKDRVVKFNGGVSESGRRIISIKEIGYEDAQCITVDALDSLYITDDFIVTHNSWTGCAWILFMGICYPNTKYFIARNELKDILDSVLVTFNKVARAYGFTDYKYNAVKNFIQFGNGSHINFIEIKYKPSDPMFEDVGSTEYTCGWIEEVGEIHQTGAAVIASRVGRHMNGKYGIKGIVFYTCNPKQNWAKTDFYDKYIAGTLESTKKYLSCLITENPFIESDYVDKLRRIGEKDKSLYERLFMGNWDYEDDPNKLCDQEMVDCIFDNDQVPQGRTYLTADVARLGSDKAVIGVWRGWRLIEMLTYDISLVTTQQDAINQLRRKYHIPKNKCIADSDGVGGGLVDNCGILGFKNNGKPLKEKGVYADKKDAPTYRNLQVQCLYHLADRVNEGGIWVMADIDSEQKKHMKQELSQIIKKTSDYGKLDLKPKSEIKRDIGRSPDYRDMLLMRVYFDLKNTTELTTNWY